MLKDFLNDHDQYCNSDLLDSGPSTTVRYLLDEELRNNKRDRISTGYKHKTPRACKLLDTVLSAMKICFFTSPSTSSASFTTISADY